MADMTAETDLLPLPEWYEACGPTVKRDMRAYARANVAHATAAKDAEIDALRTRLEDTVRESTNKIEALQAEVGRAQYAAGRWENVAKSQASWELLWSEEKARAERMEEALRAELGCLQQQYDERTACVIVHRGSALSCSDAMRTAYSDEHHRAERLAEALREAADMLLADYPETAKRLRDALEQETGRGQ